MYTSSRAMHTANGRATASAKHRHTDGGKRWPAVPVDTVPVTTMVPTFTLLFLLGLPFDLPLLMLGTFGCTLLVLRLLIKGAPCTRFGGLGREGERLRLRLRLRRWSVGVERMRGGVEAGTWVHTMKGWCLGYTGSTVLVALSCMEFVMRATAFLLKET